MLTIVVPMAGRGSRFADQGYGLPKPLIPVHSAPMIDVVVANLMPSREHRFVFLVLVEHLDQHGLREHLLGLSTGATIVPVGTVTQGAACTVLLARDEIGDGPLMIANTDQWVDAPVDDYLTGADGYDGYIMTMTASDPKWSFAEHDAEGLVTRVVEKEVVSEQATVGIYNFASGRRFVEAAEWMIEQDLKVNGEFYVAPVYNRLIAQGDRIGFHNVGSDVEGMYGLGIPSDLERFLRLPVSHTAADAALRLRHA